MLSVRLPIDVEKRLNDLSFMTGHSKSFYIRFAIVEMLNQVDALKEEQKSYLKKISENMKNQIFMQDHF